ncbi:hypothetical protein D4T97_014475 [Siminovitchia acidinfaciens]|uniref:DUF1641 domain-containing protein n=1 Tax=Siminovitchia acidinfaciens TaxID=2321395 RepID=A0A429XX58_9BACI|nr:hypothetical protein [Siminovitchia acidinfaciens]RST73081.1 hypothetical protein D4T97_014475 [Siminovitchia acidinfaciens]
METALENKNLIEKLNNPETTDSLERLLDRLPGIVEKVDKLDQLLTTVEAVLEDESAMEKLKMKIDHTNIDVNTLETGLHLLEKLPFLLHATEKFEHVALFMEEVTKDEKSMRYLIEQAEGHLQPLKERISTSKQVWETIKIDAEKNRRQITLFTVMKWMKEPQVQRVLSYVQAFINAVPNKEKRKED